MDQLAQHIESIVFVSETPISFKEVKVCLEETFETKFKKPALEKAIEELKEKYQEEQYSFEFLEIAGGFQFLTKPAFHNSVGTLLRQNNKRRLSKAALETLSIIAYKQPVVKSEMEKIRGVSCDYSVQKLLEKELIAIVGRSDAPGRPLLYGTSDKFMDYFGLKNLDEMPKPKDFSEPDNEIGEQAPIDESATALPIEEVPGEPTANGNANIAAIEDAMGTEETPLEEPHSPENMEVVEESLLEEPQPSDEKEIIENALSEDAEDYENLAADSDDNLPTDEGEDLSTEETTSTEDDE